MNYVMKHQSQHRVHFHFCFQEIYKRNFWRTFHPDMFRNPAAYDDLPQGMLSNMDVDSVADVLQLSKRSS